MQDGMCTDEDCGSYSAELLECDSDLLCRACALWHGYIAASEQ